MEEGSGGGWGRELETVGGGFGEEEAVGVGGSVLGGRRRGICEGLERPVGGRVGGGGGEAEGEQQTGHGCVGERGDALWLFTAAAAGEWGQWA